MYWRTPVQSRLCIRRSRGPRNARPKNSAPYHTAGQWRSHSSLSEARSRKIPGAWGESRYTWAHGPASDALRESGTPFADQRMENLPQMTACLPEYYFAPSLGHEHNMVLNGTCSPIWNGIGFGKALTSKSSFQVKVLIKPLEEDFIPERSNLFESHWPNQWLTQNRVNILFCNNIIAYSNIFGQPVD